VSGGGRGRHEDDDALFDALANRRPVPAAHEDDPVVRALSGWAADLDRDLPAAEPLAAVLTAPVAGGSVSRRLIRPTIAAAAVIGLVLGGGALVVHTAEPGEPFWGISRRVDPDRAASLEASREAAECLAEAEADLAAGRPDSARDRLAEARGKLLLVRVSEGRTALDVRLALLEHRLAQEPQQAPPQPAQPSTPPAPSGQGTAVPSTQPRPSRVATRPVPQPPAHPGQPGRTSPPPPGVTAPPTTTPAPSDKVRKAKETKKKRKPVKKRARQKRHVP
jgi:hypothetical protein